MNEQEKQFIDSIKTKIQKYSIKTSLREALSYSKNEFILTDYNDETNELVDIGVERFLCSISSLYFIKRYCWIPFPGKGDIPYNLYYFQEEILKEIHNFKKYIFLKTRQCLTEDNFVMTNRGYISIKDVKIGDKIETIINDKNVFVNVEDSFYTGKKETCHILTNSGLTIDCTLDHKVFTKEGWKEAKNLTLNDEMVSIINKGSFGNFKLDNDNFAAFIGYYLADGKYNYPIFTNTNIDYINEMSEIGKFFENCESYIYKRKNYKNSKMRLQAYDVRFVSKTKNTKLYRPIKIFIHKFGLDVKSTDRFLTNELMNLNEKQMSILLNRLYAGDGWITYKKDRRRPNYIAYEIGLGSPCYKLIKQIEYILQTKYNIHCYIMECFDKRNKNWKRFWKLRISQKKSVINFINKIGIKGKTDKEKIINLISKEEPYNTNQSFEKIRKIIHKKGLYDVYDITTESSNFLTNGLLVHNCGISTLMALYCFWKANFHESEYIDVISTQQKKARKFVSKIDPTLKRMPTFLKTRIIAKNQSVIKWENGSEILSEAASARAGRGDSLSLLILDEAAHYLSDNLTRGIVAAAMPTLARTGGDSIVISTPNSTSGAGSYYYEQVNQLRLSGNTDKEKLIEIDWWEVPDIEDIKPFKGYNNKLENLMSKQYFNSRILRDTAREIFEPVAKEWRDNDWLKKQHDELGDILYKQEIMHDFVVGENLVFTADILERIREKIKGANPIYENMLGKTQAPGLIIWKNPIPKHRYIMGIDVGRGTSKDFSAIQIMDVELNEQVAEYHAKIGTKLFGRFIKKLARFYNEAFVVIECNGIGEAVFNEVYASDIEPYENLYKQKKTKNGKVFISGHETTSKTRPLIINKLVDYLTIDELFEEITINSSRLYSELTTFVWTSAGRAEHDEASNDDLILSMSLCLFYRNKADKSGESFLINEEGVFIESTRSDYEKEEVSDNEFDFVFSDDNKMEDIYQKRHGCSHEDYNWLIGKHD